MKALSGKRQFSGSLNLSQASLLGRGEINRFKIYIILFLRRLIFYTLCDYSYLAWLPGWIFVSWQFPQRDDRVDLADAKFHAFLGNELSDCF